MNVSLVSRNGSFAVVRLLSAALCGNGLLEQGEDCDGGACCDNRCRFRPSSIICRASSGPCDLEERCSGSSSTCPQNSFLPEVLFFFVFGVVLFLFFLEKGTLCRNSTLGPCDVPDYCTASGTCPNSFASDGTRCLLAACPSVPGTCISRQCLGECVTAAPSPRCGDGQCGLAEDCKSCPEDCPRAARLCCAYWGCAGRACPESPSAMHALCRNSPQQSLLPTVACLFGECQ
jgi:hypothetical protein